MIGARAVKNTEYELSDGPGLITISAWFSKKGGEGAFAKGSIDHYNCLTEFVLSRP